MFIVTVYVQFMELYEFKTTVLNRWGTAHISNGLQIVWLLKNKDAIAEIEKIV